MDGKTQEAAAAAAGMSVRSAGKWEKGSLPSETKKARSWRTRVDPFSEVWDTEVVPLLRADDKRELEATTVLGVLDGKFPGRWGRGQVRTLQRRIRDWRAMFGPDKEVYFEQVHVPGREGAFDFTHGTELGVTIDGEPFRHLLFEFVLSYSRWTWVGIAFSETYEALVAGLQGAFWTLGSVPSVLRHDNLSAATHELKKTSGRALNTRFKDFLDHYRVGSKPIQPRKAHENGSVEQRHYRTKSAIAQAMIIRGSKDFESQEAYLIFVRKTIDESHNRHVTDRLAEERVHLEKLPSHPVPTYTEFECVVRKWSTIRLGCRGYSVPSRLIGHTLTVRQHADVVEVFYGDRLVETMPRIRGELENRIDYRHIIGSLVRKPGAFARYRYREELFPSMVFRLAYDALKEAHGERADIEYVRILHLAATTMECQVEKALIEKLGGIAPLDYASIKAIVKPEEPTVPNLNVREPDLSSYDALLTGGAQ